MAEQVLSRGSVEVIARRVVELLRPELFECICRGAPTGALEARTADDSCRPTDKPAAESWVSAAVLARRLGVSRNWVYQHADELGAKRLGAGPKARMRFKVEVAEQAACFASRGSGTAARPVVERKTRRRRQSGFGTTVPLLPIRGGLSPISGGRGGAEA